ncbi:MAG TPA: serine/threonine-protein kinase [Gemmataceae bacterium]|nr:serine/threonine-protein kinase [Gemmataceae bacterium]
MSPLVVCPDLSRYQLLACGKLAEAEEQPLLAHLERCEACAQKLKAVGGADPLERLLGRAIGKDAPGAPVARLIERLSKLRPGDTSDVRQQETVGPHEPPLDAPLTLTCPACRKALKIRQESVGKNVKCPHCQQLLRVPDQVADRGSKAEATAAYVAGAAASPRKADASGDREDYDFLAPPQAPDEIGRLGPYRVLEVLGAGGMGVVFRAEDPQLVRLVALKAMLPSLAASASARQRFVREAQAAAALKHDHIVTIYQVSEDRGVPFLAMEFLEGEPLNARLEREGKLPLAEILRIGREIALALAAAHKRELIHRDIKPANIWLEGEPAPAGAGASASGSFVIGARVKILDFGLARAVREGTQLTQQGAIIGTPAYMAPEQAQGQSLDGSCDLFSLGCVLYRMATGVPAFRGTDIVSTLMAVATEEPKPPVSLNLELPTRLSDLILRLLAKTPEERPPSAQAVADELHAITEAEKLPKPKVAEAPSPRTQPAARQGKKRRFLLAAAAALFAAAILAAVVIFWQTPQGTSPHRKRRSHRRDCLRQDRADHQGGRQGADLPAARRTPHPRQTRLFHLRDRQARDPQGEDNHAPGAAAGGQDSGEGGWPNNRGHGVAGR